MENIIQREREDKMEVTNNNLRHNFSQIVGYFFRIDGNFN